MSGTLPSHSRMRVIREPLSPLRAADDNTNGFPSRSDSTATTPRSMDTRTPPHMLTPFTPSTSTPTNTHASVRDRPASLPRSLHVSEDSSALVEDDDEDPLLQAAQHPPTSADASMQMQRPFAESLGISNRAQASLLFLSSTPVIHSSRPTPRISVHIHNDLEDTPSTEVILGHENRSKQMLDRLFLDVMERERAQLAEEQSARLLSAAEANTQVAMFLNRSLQHDWHCDGVVSSCHLGSDERNMALFREAVNVIADCPARMLDALTCLVGSDQAETALCSWEMLVVPWVRCNTLGVTISMDTGNPQLHAFRLFFWQKHIMPFVNTWLRPDKLHELMAAKRKQTIQCFATYDWRLAVEVVISPVERTSKQPPRHCHLPVNCKPAELAARILREFEDTDTIAHTLSVDGVEARDSEALVRMWMDVCQPGAQTCHVLVLGVSSDDSLVRLAVRMRYVSFAVERPSTDRARPDGASIAASAGDVQAL
jgi:hypothetical protein